jgi:hypothetical protein
MIALWSKELPKNKKRLLVLSSLIQRKKSLWKEKWLQWVKECGTKPAKKKGDKVLFAKWGGTEIKIDGQEYLIMKESDILAIVNG